MRKLTADEVQETTNTAGGGTVTLSQAAGWFRFSDRFAVNDLVYYSIRDGANWENGIGTVGAANTLARTTVLSTLSGGVAGSGAAINLSGAAAIVRAVISEELFSKVLKVENVLVAASQAAVDGFSYGITANNVVLTLAAAPQVNDRVEVYQAAAGPLTGCTVDPNGGKINNVAAVMALDVPDFSFSLIFVSAGYGWKVDR